MIYHRGMADALGVTEDRLANMTIREMVERAFDLGFIIQVNESGGDGPGLTLRSEQVTHAGADGTDRQ